MKKTTEEKPMYLAIVRTATELFFERGFSKTTAMSICRRLNIGTGNLTFYFPTKEHILDVMTRMICDFQWKRMEEAADEGKSSLLAYCLELTTMAAICEESEIMHDIYVSSYTSPLTLETIRANDVEKLKQVFGGYCEGWSDERFVEAEAIVSGIEYATMMTTKHSASLPVRIEGALDSIMMILGVPEETRRLKIKKVLAMDYREIGRQLLCDFKEYTREENERALNRLLERYGFK